MASITELFKDLFVQYTDGIGVDFGCGSDVMTNAIGVDYEYQYNTNILPKTSATFIGSWEDFLYQYDGPMLDFIYSSHLIEDFERPYEILEQWSNILKDDGYLILVLPIEEVYIDYCIKNNIAINASHKSRWEHAMDFMEQMPLSLYRQYDIVEFRNNIFNYNFYIVLKKKKPKKNCVIYLTYNSGHAMRILLPRLILFESLDTDIIGIDNNSTDDTIEVFKQLGIKYIKNKENEFFTKGINQGLKYAKDNGYEWVYIINPDVGVGLGWDVNIFRNVPQDAYIIGAQMVNQDEEVHHSGGTIMTVPLQQSMHIYEEINDKIEIQSAVPYSCSRLNHRISTSESFEVEKVPWVTFSFVAIKLELLDKINLLDERFIMYSSDAEYCLRAWENNCSVYYNPIKFVHAVGGSSRQRGDWLLDIVRNDSRYMREIEEDLIKRSGNKWLL